MHLGYLLINAEKSSKILLKIFGDLQWDQSSPGNSAYHNSDQSIIELNFLAA